MTWQSCWLSLLACLHAVDRPVSSVSSFQCLPARQLTGLPASLSCSLLLCQWPRGQVCSHGLDPRALMTMQYSLGTTLPVSAGLLSQSTWHCLQERSTKASARSMEVQQVCFDPKPRAEEKRKCIFEADERCFMSTIKSRYGAEGGVIDTTGERNVRCQRLAHLI